MSCSRKLTATMYLPLTPDAPGLHELMREVVEGRKMATENAHHWRQTKHLLRYVKAQEREIGKTERYMYTYTYIA